MPNTIPGERAPAAAHQVSAALNRSASNEAGPHAQVAGPVESPTDIEIRVSEAAASPLTRVADAAARVITRAGEAVYDYSGGRYGLAPVDAADVRRAREKERAHERPVTIIERRHEAAPAKGKRRALLLAIAGTVVVAAIVALVVWRRRRLRRLSARPVPAVVWEPSGPVAPTPMFDRVIRGALIPHPPIAPAGTSAGGMPPVHDGHTRGSVASEFSETNPPRE